MLAGALGIAGGLMGATLDSSRTREVELYRRPVSASPLLSHERVGAVLSISW